MSRRSPGGGALSRRCFDQGPTGGLNQRRLYPWEHEPVTMFLPDVRYDEMVRALGGYGEYVDDPAQMRPAFGRARESGLPACLNVKVDPFMPFVKRRG